MTDGRSWEWICTGEIGLLEEVIAELLRGHAGYAAIQALPGIGPVPAAVVVAEIGDITRFTRPEKLACWAGLTPRHRESDVKVARGHITKQGSPALRWALIEAVQRQRAGSPIRVVRDRILARRGKQANNIAKVAAARKLAVLVFYGMRDGHIRAGGGNASVIDPAGSARETPHATSRRREDPGEGMTAAGLPCLGDDCTWGT